MDAFNPRELWRVPLKKKLDVGQLPALLGEGHQAHRSMQVEQQDQGIVVACIVHFRQFEKQQPVGKCHSPSEGWGQSIFCGLVTSCGSAKIPALPWAAETAGHGDTDVEVKLVLGSTGAVSLPTCGRSFLEAQPFGNPHAAEGAGANVICRDPAGWCRVGACAESLGYALQRGTGTKAGLEMC